MAASPSAGTPTSAASPPNLAPAPPMLQRPSLCVKPTNAASSLAPHTGPLIKSLTTKEWVVPPRPKPGRKPATDTPPTKRKAQNRAAQRAFRERRAARVGELEEQMKQIEEDHEQQQEDLKASVIRLEEEVTQYRVQLTTWMDRCRQLEKEMTDMRASHGHMIAVGPEVQMQLHTSLPNGSESAGCGNCTMDTRCQCIDDAFHAMDGQPIDTQQLHSDVRPESPVRLHSDKRVKREVPESMEIDFTTMFSRPSDTTQVEAVSPTSAVADPCGFCQDGTPCICAEMAAEQDGRDVVPVASGRQLAQFTPPPSEGDVSHTIGALPTQATGPGTCAQCRADPNSTLFCKSLAASRARSGIPMAGCCGGKGAAGGCCQDSVPLPARNTRSKAAASKTQLPPLQASRSSVTLTCADAYTTLSRHPAFDRASSDIATWMPKLHANPSAAEGRPAMEIDAANVMAVLRDFDRRFGADR